MNKIKISAPSKLSLFGKHAVKYGRKDIDSFICRVHRITSLDSNFIQLYFKPLSSLLYTKV